MVHEMAVTVVIVDVSTVPTRKSLHGAYDSSVLCWGSRRSVGLSRCGKCICAYRYGLFGPVMWCLETLSRLETVSRQTFRCIGLGLGLEGHCLGLGLGLGC
jgi:hypothetical protein